MEYKIPSSIAPYLEYIPDNMLSEIITEALRAAIFKSPEEPQEKPADTTITQLLEQLKAAIGTGNLQAVQEVKTAMEKPAFKAEPIIVQTTDDEDLPPDLRDIVGEFAGGMFK